MIMANKINLDEIFVRNYVLDSSGCYTDESITAMMLDFGERLLELAYENGEVVYMSDTLGEITLSASERKKYRLKKSSITDTINEVNKL